jgi:hypothetical protein
MTISLTDPFIARKIEEVERSPRTSRLRVVGGGRRRSLGGIIAAKITEMDAPSAEGLVLASSKSGSEWIASNRVVGIVFMTIRRN